MFKGITQSENVNAPSNDIVVLHRVHIFPSELHMFSQCETMNVNFGSSSNDIGLSTELSSSSRGKNLN